MYIASIDDKRYDYDYLSIRVSITNTHTYHRYTMMWMMPRAPVHYAAVVVMSSRRSLNTKVRRQIHLCEPGAQRGQGGCPHGGP